MKNFITHRKSLRSFRNEQIYQKVDSRVSYTHRPSKKIVDYSFLMSLVSQTAEAKEKDYSTVVFLCLGLVVTAGIVVASSYDGGVSFSGLQVRQASVLTSSQPIFSLNRVLFFPLLRESKPQTAQRLGREKSSISVGLSVRDITNELTQCTIKKDGQTPGKVCLIDNVRHYLKVLPKSKLNSPHSFSLLEIYNLAMVKHTLGVMTPQVFLASESQQLKVQGVEMYLASVEVKNLTLAEVITSKLAKQVLIMNHRKLVVPPLTTLKREAFISHLGEMGIAKLAIVGTFFQDLINNDGNWGFNQDGLIIIDADHSPKTLGEYLSEAARVPYNIGMDFSLNTVLKMRDSYNEMAAQSPPQFDADVDMSNDFYQTLIRYYYSACEQAAQMIQRVYPERDPDDASQDINNILASSFLNILKQVHHQGEDLDRPRQEASTLPHFNIL